MQQRTFNIDEFVRPSADVPIRSVVQESPDSVVIVWHVAPGQQIAPHIHPAGQDTWTVIRGSADYLAGDGKSVALSQGMIAVARPGEVHGAVNHGEEPFIFVSVVSSDQAGYELCEG